MRIALAVLSSVFVLGCGTQVPTDTGGTGGGTGVTARCNTSNCAGCCDASDVCQLGQSISSCGTGGNACLACGAGLVCTSGACVPGQNSGSKRIFLTRATYTGNLKTAGGGSTGLAGGDALCDTAATAAGIGGSWQAWLSAGLVNAVDRIQATGPWLLVGTTNVVFNNKANLRTVPLIAIDRDELGQPNSHDAWTGTITGGGAATNNCGGWATDSVGYGGTGGPTIASAWTDNGSSNCYFTKSLICFEK